MRIPLAEGYRADAPSFAGTMDDRPSAFAAADDGMLARDINGNGKIDDANELFGQGDVYGFEILARTRGGKPTYSLQV